MLLKLDAHMQSFGESGYVAWINNSKNFKMVVHGSTPEETTKELVTSLKVTMSYLFGVSLSNIQEGKASSESEIRILSDSLKLNGTGELKLQLA